MLRLSVIVLVSLALTFVVAPPAGAFPPVCLEKSVGAAPVGSVEVWITCYPGVWRCHPGQQMPDCERVDEGILS